MELLEKLQASEFGEEGVFMRNVALTECFNVVLPCCCCSSSSMVSLLEMKIVN